MCPCDCCGTPQPRHQDCRPRPPPHTARSAWTGQNFCLVLPLTLPSAPSPPAPASPSQSDRQVTVDSSQADGLGQGARSEMLPVFCVSCALKTQGNRPKRESLSAVPSNGLSYSCGAPGNGALNPSMRNHRPAPDRDLPETRHPKGSGRATARPPYCLV